MSARRAVYLVRHAQASFGAEDYDALSEVGHAQARVLGAALRERVPRVDRAVVGRMRRHRETAEACLGAMGAHVAIEEDRGWDEYDHEAVLRAYDPRYSERAAIAEDILKEDDPPRAFQRIFARAVGRWASGAHDHEYHESWSAFCARVGAALGRLQESPAETTLVFTSGGPILAACKDILRLPSDEAVRMGWALANASVTQLTASESGFRLTTFNEHAWYFERGASPLLTFR